MVSAPIRGAPLVFGDRVFTMSIDNKLHAMAAVDGSDLWNFSALQEVAGYIGGNSPAGSGDTIVAPFTSGELVGCAPIMAAPVWNESLVGPRREFARLRQPGRHPRPARDRSRPVLAMGTAGTLAAIDLRSGQRQWERNIGGNQTPWVAGRFVFVVTGSADVAALERDTGKVKWVTPLSQYQDENRRKPMIWAGRCSRPTGCWSAARPARCCRCRPIPARSSASSTCGRRCGSRRWWPIAWSSS